MFRAIAIVLALAAAAVFGLSSVLEQHSTKQVPTRRALSPRLLLDLLHRPVFIAAIAVNIVGSALQVVALHFGPLALVQPILVLNLLFAVVIGAATMRRRGPDRVMLVGVVCCVAGIGVFLAVAQPSGGYRMVSPGAGPPLIVGLAAVVAACLAAVQWGPRRWRPLWLALACGVDFGVNAFLLKVVPNMLPEGFGDPLRQWPLYMLVVVVPVGFLLNLNAFQAGILIAPVLAVITTVDPLVSIGIAHVLLHESIPGSPLELAAEAAALAAMAGGIAVLAHYAPQVARRVTGEGQASGRALSRRGRAAPGGCRRGGQGWPTYVVLRFVKMTAALERVLRVFLADVSARRHGYDLMKAAGLPSGTLYPMLARLQDQGLVVSEWEAQPEQDAGRPRRKYYQLTGEGVRVARLQLAQASGSAPRGRAGVVRPARGSAR